MVNRRMKWRKITVARLELNLFPLHSPPPCFLSLFLSLPPSLPPHLRLLRSPWRETSVPPLSAQRRWQRPSFSFITSLSLSLKQSTHAHLIAVHFSLDPSFSAYTSVHLPLKKTLLTVRQPREKTGGFGGRGGRKI